MTNRIRKKESNFTQVSNSFLRDNRLSFKAKGLFCYMFSMSSDWNFTIQSIAKQQNEGVASISSALKELKEYGFVTYTKNSDGSGVYYLDDEPKSENPNMENPNMENPNMENQSVLRIDNQSEQKLIENTNSKENIKSKFSQSKIQEKLDRDNLAKKTIDFLNQTVNNRFGYTDGNLKEIKSQINKLIKNGDDLKTIEDKFAYVIKVKSKEWLNNQEMKKHLNPVTLFRESNFDKYLNQDMGFSASDLVDRIYEARNAK